MAASPFLTDAASLIWQLPSLATPILVSEDPPCRHAVHHAVHHAAPLPSPSSSFVFVLSCTLHTYDTHAHAFTRTLHSRVTKGHKTSLFTRLFTRFTFTRLFTRFTFTICSHIHLLTPHLHTSSHLRLARASTHACKCPRVACKHRQQIALDWAAELPILATPSTWQGVVGHVLVPRAVVAHCRAASGRALTRALAGWPVMQPVRNLTKVGTRVRP